MSPEKSTLFRILGSHNTMTVKKPSWYAIDGILTFIIRLGSCPWPAICSSVFSRPALQRCCPLELEWSFARLRFKILSYEDFVGFSKSLIVPSSELTRALGLRNPNTRIHCSCFLQELFSQCNAAASGAHLHNDSSSWDSHRQETLSSCNLSC